MTEAILLLCAFLSAILFLLCLSLVYEYRRHRQIMYLIEAICIFLAYVSGGVLVNLIIRKI